MTLKDGMVLRFKAVNANTGASTLAVNGLAAYPILGGGTCIVGRHWGRPGDSFRIDVKHPTTGRRSTGIFTETLTFSFPGFLFDPFCFGTGEFKPNQAVLSFGPPFRFHGKWRIVWTTGMPSALTGQSDRKVYHADSMEWKFFQISSSPKERLINRRTLPKAASPMKSLGTIRRVLFKEVWKNRNQGLVSWSDLSSSGESDFFSTEISGWSARKFAS